MLLTHRAAQRNCAHANRSWQKPCRAHCAKSLMMIVQFIALLGGDARFRSGRRISSAVCAMQDSNDMAVRSLRAKRGNAENSICRRSATGRKRSESEIAIACAQPPSNKKGAIGKRPPPRARPLSHIRVYEKRARPLREKRPKEYMRGLLRPRKAPYIGKRRRQPAERNHVVNPTQPTWPQQASRRIVEKSVNRAIHIML